MIGGGGEKDKQLKTCVMKISMRNDLNRLCFRESSRNRAVSDSLQAGLKAEGLT